MLKNMLLASAAAFVVLGAAASLTNMKAVITSGNGADAALTRDASDFNAQLRELHTEQVRQATLLSVQDTTIRRLQRDLARAEQAALTAGIGAGGTMPVAVDDAWSIGLDMPSAGHAERAAEYHAAWFQAIMLEDELASAQKAYRDLESNSGARMAAIERQTADRIASLEQQSAERVATLERDHRFAVERFEAEIEQRDNSIVGLMHRIVSMQSGGAAATTVMPTPAKVAAAQPMSTPQAVVAKAPVRAAAPPAAAPTVADKPADPAQGAATRTVADGVVAYHAGDYHEAFEIWRVLANAGDARARFHLGALYYEGRGVERQLETAQVLLGMAAAAGHEGAAELRDKVTAELARAQVARAPDVSAK